MLGEPPEDPLLLFSVLYSFWAASWMAFNGDVVCELAAQFLALAQKQGATVPLMVGHRLMGVSLQYVGDPAQGRAHLDRAIAFYDPAVHRPLATRFGADIRVAILFFRSLSLWLFGYPDAAEVDLDYAIKEAREIGMASTLLPTLSNASLTHICARNYASAKAEADELCAFADDKGAAFWKARGTTHQGSVLALTGSDAEAVRVLTSGVTALWSTGGTLLGPSHLAYLARAHAGLGQFDDAWRRTGEAIAAMETTREKWIEPEVYRIAGEIALMMPASDTAKAEGYFDRALSVARAQRAKSWELRTATSLARLRRDQGKPDAARDLLVPVYDWFTEGFDTPDLKEAKALLEELRA